MTDGVHAAMHAGAAAPVAAVVNGVLPEPQLPAGHHSVLTTRQAQPTRTSVFANRAYRG